MSHIQHLMYEGFLGADPVLRYTPAGKAVANFNLGSSRKYKNAEGEAVTETTWIRVSAWGKLAENINKMCEKGSHVIVEGALRPGKNGSPDVYELKNGGYGASYDVTAHTIRILSGKKNTPKAEDDFDDEANSLPGTDDEEDIPF